MASAVPAARNRPPVAAPAAEATADVPLLPVANHGLLVVGIMTASVLQVLDATIANVAVPHMQTALGATPDTVTWVLTSYILAAAVATPITGWLAGRVGSRRLFIGSVAGFVLASMLCGAAQSLEAMVLFRVLQGISGAFIGPLSQAAMLDTAPPSRHAQMMSVWGLGIMVGPIMGPVLGGWLTENWNWRWVFYVNVPLGALAMGILIAALPSRPIERTRFDVFGFSLLAIALAALQLLLDRGHQIDWFESPEAWVYGCLVISAGWIAVIHLATARAPLFDRAMFADRNFTVSLLFMIIIGVVMFATMALLPPMLQHLFGYSVIDTGIVLGPRGVGVAISMVAAGQLMRRGLDPRLIIAVGLGIASYSLYDMSLWSLAVDRNHFIVTGVVQGIGMGLVFIPLNAMAFNTLPPRLRTDGSSLINLARSLGASVGISIVTVLLARNTQTAHADLAAELTGETGSMIDFSTVDRFQSLGDAALRMADAEVTRQAGMIAYIDDFRLMGWMTLAAIPLTLLMRRPSIPGGGPTEPPPGH